MNIGDGRNTSIWSDPWIPQLVSFKLPSSINYLVDITMVANLIDHSAIELKYQLVKYLFALDRQLFSLSR